MTVEFRLQVWAIMEAASGRLVRLFELKVAAEEARNRAQAIEEDTELVVVGPIDVSPDGKHWMCDSSNSVN